MFTDRNAYYATAAYSEGIVPLDDVVDWDLMEARDWKNTEAEPDRMDRLGQSALVRCGTGARTRAVRLDARRGGGSDPPGVTLSERARAGLAEMRSEFPFARRGRGSVVIESTRARWWTWAGQRANASLGDALGDLAASAGDDLSIGLDVERASTAAVREAFVDLHPDTLPTPRIAAEFAENMKFSDCLPPTLALEVARQRLVDPAGVSRVLSELAAGANEI